MRLLGLMAALCLGVGWARAQTPASSNLAAQGLFPFALPWNDGATGPTDVSFLSDAPAGKHGFLRASGENFVDGRGVPVRLWGVNLNFSGAFPAKTEAPLIAARLAKFGFNSVRLHHYEGNAAPNGIWVGAAIGSSKLKWPNEFDAAQLDKWDFFVAELIKHGIYVDLNLHVARKVTEADGFVDAARMPEKDKGFPYFEARLEARNREFARLMLSRVNPYLGRAYKDEPGLCALEVDNESSLLAQYLDGSMAKFPTVYADDLRARWNVWVAAKYGSEAALHRAWTEFEAPLSGPELLAPQNVPTPLPTPVAVEVALESQPIAAPTLDNWQLSLAGGAQGFQSREELGGPAQEGIVQPGLSLQLQKAGTVSWSFQSSRSGLNIEDGRVYTLRFSGRSETRRVVSVNLWEDRQPFRWLGVSKNVVLNPDWSDYAVSFRTSGAVAGQVRISFNFGNSVGNLQLSALSLRAGGILAASDEWTRRGNIPLISALEEPIFAVRRDFAQFLGEIERAHVARWREFLKRDLGVQIPIWHTQAQFGGWGGVEREKLSDAIDVHIYWKHPEFGANAWDGTNWRVANESLVGATAGDPLAAYSLARVPNKPFVVTEWNSGQPNDFGAESLLMMAAHAAHQGWAGVWVFDYHSSGAWNRTKFENFFSIDAQSAKMVTAPLAALLFRRGDVAGATTTQFLAFNAEQMWDEVANTPSGPTMAPFFKTWNRAGAGTALALTGRTQIADVATVFPVASEASLREPKVWISDTRQLKREVQNRIWSVNAPLSKSFAGFVANARLKLGELELWFPDSAKFAAGGLTSMDGSPLETSKKLLLVMVGRAENPGMVWNATRDSLSNWGNGPTHLAAPSAIVKFSTDAKDVRVWALDERGQRRTPVPATLKNGALKFQPSNLWRTVWYEIQLF